MRSTPLHGRKLNGTGFAADLALDIPRQESCRSGKLLVTEGVHEIHTISVITNIFAVFVPNAFGNRYTNEGTVF